MLRCLMRPAVGPDTRHYARLNREVLEGGFPMVMTTKLQVFADGGISPAMCSMMVAGAMAMRAASGQRKGITRQPGSASPWELQRRAGRSRKRSAGRGAGGARHPWHGIAGDAGAPAAHADPGPQHLQRPAHLQSRPGRRASGDVRLHRGLRRDWVVTSGEYGAHDGAGIADARRSRDRSGRCRSCRAASRPIDWRRLLREDRQRRPHADRRVRWMAMRRVCATPPASSATRWTGRRRAGAMGVRHRMADVWHGQRIVDADREGPCPRTLAETGLSRRQEFPCAGRDDRAVPAQLRARAAGGPMQELAVDGAAGPKTIEAIEKFQRGNGCTCDGWWIRAAPLCATCRPGRMTPTEPAAGPAAAKGPANPFGRRASPAGRQGGGGPGDPFGQSAASWAVKRRSWRSVRAKGFGQPGGKSRRSVPEGSRPAGRQGRRPGDPFKQKAVAAWWGAADSFPQKGGGWLLRPRMVGAADPARTPPPSCAKSQMPGGSGQQPRLEAGASAFPAVWIASRIHRLGRTPTRHPRRDGG